MSVMFANRSQQPAGGTGYLLEFQAGRTLIEPGSTPEKRKAVASPEPGLVYIKHSQDDQLLHFCWKNRQENATELDLIIFPGETEFLRINECPDGRVFMLKFKNSQERHLFWMQDQNVDKDEEIQKKMNELLTNAPPTRAAPRAGGQLSGIAALNSALGGNIEDIGALGNMDQNQLMRLFSLMNGSGGSAAELLPHLSARSDGSTQPPMGPLSALIRRGASSQTSSQQQQADQTTTSSDASSAAATTGSTTGGGAINAQMLNNIISALPAGTSEKMKRQAVELSTVLNRGNTQEVVNKYKEQLVPHVPDQKPMQDANTELAQTVGNPQFQQAADFIGQALQMGQLGPALEHFHLDKTVIEAANKGDLVQFAKKLTDQENPKQAEATKQIEEQANAEENVASMLAKREKVEKEKALKKQQDAKKPPPQIDDDGMDLD